MPEGLASAPGVQTGRRARPCCCAAASAAARRWPPASRQSRHGCWASQYCSQISAPQSHLPGYLVPAAGKVKKALQAFFGATNGGVSLYDVAGHQTVAADVLRWARAALFLPHHTAATNCNCLRHIFLDVPCCVRCRLTSNPNALLNPVCPLPTPRPLQRQGRGGAAACGQGQGLRGGCGGGPGAHVPGQRPQPRLPPAAD